MEKTTHITIGGTSFELAESAYEELHAYLESLKAHFAGEEDRDEIIRDIEARIAEKLLEKKRRLVAREDICAVLAEMGDASQFDAEAEAPQRAAGAKKFYRDGEHAVVGGVAAGIAAYFDIDPVFVRLVFALSMLFGGAGFVLYALLWLIVPEAKSASQKLEMRGAHVTLETISRTVKDRLNETKERGAFKKVFYFPFEVARAILRFVFGRFLPLAGRFLGVLLAAGSFLAILALSMCVSIFATNWNQPYISPAAHALVSDPLLWTGAAAGFLTLALPLFFLLIFGVRLVRCKNILGSAASLGLVGIWCLSVVASGVVATRVASNYYTYTLIHPEARSAMPLFVEMEKEVQNEMPLFGKYEATSTQPR